MEKCACEQPASAMHARTAEVEEHSPCTIHHLKYLWLQQMVIMKQP